MVLIGIATLGRDADMRTKAGWRVPEASVIKAIVLDTWAGRRYYAVEVVGETFKKARVRILTPGGVMLPRRRYAQYNEIVWVPKHALSELPADAQLGSSPSAGSAFQ